MQVSVALILSVLSFGTLCGASDMNPTDFGAKADGKTDDTAALQAALNKAGETGGGIVELPVGQFRLDGSLTIPSGVTLQGVWKTPHFSYPGQGTTLLAYGGRGKAEGPPLIMLETNSAVCGLTVFYPEQRADDIQPYPWTIQGRGTHLNVSDVTLLNPYQGIDFGTYPHEMHYIRNVYGCPLKIGVHLDQCTDIGRVENVHFNPNSWTRSGAPNAPTGDLGNKLVEYMQANLTAFAIGRSDWEFMLNTFSWGAHIGYRFYTSAAGPTNGSFLGIAADWAVIPLLVEGTQEPGLLITNGEFVSFAGKAPTEVVVTATHTGVVQFQNCSYWGPAHQIARIAGTGTVSFNGCNFVEWDREGKGTPAITLFGGNLLVNGCNFMKSSPQLALRGTSQSAVFVGNRLAGPLAIANPVRAQLQVGLNAARVAASPRRPVEQAGAIVLDDGDGRPGVTFTGDWQFAPEGGNYYRGVHWAQPGQGEAQAVFRPLVPRAGRYAVSVFLGPDPNRDHAGDAPVTVRSAAGVSTRRLDLRPQRGEWVSLGVFRFAAGRAGSITFTNAAHGNVIADAVKLVPAR